MSGNSIEEDMKPFDLEKALEGYPVVTRDGKKIREIKLFDKVEQPLVCFIENIRTPQNFSKEGKWFFGKSESDNDLFMASEKKTMWMAYSESFDTTALFQTRAELINTFADENGWKIIPVEIEV